MSYENIKKELQDAVTSHYDGGASIIDIRAALRAADLYAEQMGALELVEIAKRSIEDGTN